MVMPIWIICTPKNRFPEVILAQGKTSDQVTQIFINIQAQQQVLAAK
jgi:NCAIR mutase (PurE)-related protein